MRSVLAFLAVLTFLISPALAQGVKDQPNLTSTSILTTPTKKAQTNQADSRPTAVRNLAGRLPAGKSVQGVWRDGKLIAVPR